MFQRILVPLDGSRRAEQAIPVAARLARANDGTVILVAVEDVAADTVAAVAPAPQEVFDRQREAGHTYLTGITMRTDLAGLVIETDHAQGVVAETLLATAAAHQVDLIAMTGHTGTGTHRWALGSVAEQVARQAPMPVLILREPLPDALTSSDASARGARPLHLLVPLDGSPFAERALLPAAHLLEALAPARARIFHLTRVVSVFALGGRNLLGSLMESVAWHEARRYLLTTVERLQAGELAPLQVEVCWSVTSSHDVAAGIVDVAGAGTQREGTAPPGGCDIIAMATQHRHSPERWAFGSVTERVLHGTQLPLLVVRKRPPASCAQLRELPRAIDQAS